MNGSRGLFNQRANSHGAEEGVLVAQTLVVSVIVHRLAQDSACCTLLQPNRTEVIQTAGTTLFGERHTIIKTNVRIDTFAFM